MTCITGGSLRETLRLASGLHMRHSWFASLAAVCTNHPFATIAVVCIGMWLSRTLPLQHPLPSKTNSRSFTPPSNHPQTIFVAEMQQTLS